MDKITASPGLSFRIGFTGHSGHLRVEQLPLVESSNPAKLLPDFVIPPAIPEEASESIKRHIEEKYLFPRLDPYEFSPEKAGKQWPFDWFDEAKIQMQPTEQRTAVISKWEAPFRRKKEAASQLMSLEVEISELLPSNESGLPSFSPGPMRDFVRGSMKNHPFRPGGLDDSRGLNKAIPAGASNGTWITEVLNGVNTQIIPPTFKRGMDFGDLKGHSYEWTVYKSGGLADSVGDARTDELSINFNDIFKKAFEMDVEQHFVAEDVESPALDIKDCSGDESSDVQKNESGLLDVESPALEIKDCSDDEFSVVPKNESGLLDEILSFHSMESMPKQDPIVDCRDRSQKETWVVSGGCGGIANRFHELVPQLALDFPFELDTFQKEAIYYLERGDSVFVAAHTSAGKTVVAEYAFALSSKHCTRAIYTAPIKTISNQKYRDFCGKFDVGLLTGDVSLNPDASCLIMTTEILRSMLYKGADIIRDVEWVIFDEVHYVNDIERGVVWEEVIIMLPWHINIILLSATVPNTVEFADWIGRTKQKKIHVTGTTKRPVPLEHCLSYFGEFYRICEDETFISHALNAAKDAHKRKTLHPASAPAGREATRSQKHDTPAHEATRSGSGNSGGGPTTWISKRAEAFIWTSLIRNLSKSSLLPVVIFCFSKTRCDKSADNLSGVDLTTTSEKSQIHIFCNRAFSRLKGSDKSLPQILRVQSLLKRGIGVHHAGLLPIVKEVVEMLFCRGVIKVLFSTETFAMGVNAPARTVVFDSLRKFDGKGYRELLPGEYTQMAGRAGRRGLDKTGTVVTMCRTEIPDEADLKRMIVGSATKLKSQFRLTYIMILQLLRVEELKVEDMLKRSFAEFHSQQKLPEKQQLLMLKLAQPLKGIECIRGEPAIEEYYENHTEADKYRGRVMETAMRSAQKFLSLGRVVVVKSETAEDHFLGVVVKPAGAGNGGQPIVLMVVPDAVRPPSTVLPGLEEFGRVLVPKSKRGFEDDFYSLNKLRRGSGTVNVKLPRSGSAAGAYYEMREVDGRELLCICSSMLQVDQVALLEEDNTAAYSRTVQLLLNLKPPAKKYPPALDPLKDLKMKDTEAVSVYYEWNRLLQRMSESKCHGCIRLRDHMKWAKEAKRHSEEVDALRFQMSDESLQQMPDFYGRIEVLKELGCVDEDLVVQMKGRVACEMNSAEELICTECLFGNQLEELEAEEAVAVMSAFVFQQNRCSTPTLSPKLSRACGRLHSTALSLGQLQAGFKLQIDPEDYVAENLKFGLVEVVHEWAKGTPFAEICELTDVPEGIIVRTILRLDETCREFRNAAAIMGNPALRKKMEAASTAIRRDIIFSTSLYVTGV